MPEQLSNILENQPGSTAPPNTTPEYYAESFTDVLVRSIGYYATCEFLIGNNTLVEKNGIIYAAGMNFITLKDPDREQYTVCDIYSLKFVTLYNSKTRPAHLEPTFNFQLPTPPTLPQNRAFPQQGQPGTPTQSGFTNRSSSLR